MTAELDNLVKGVREGPSQYDASKLVGNTLLVLAATGFGLGLNYVYAIGLARFLGPEDFGLFAIGLAVFNVVSVLSIGGLDHAALRYLTSPDTGEVSASSWSTVRTLLAVTLGGGLLWGGCVVLLRGGLAGDFFHDSRLPMVFLCFAVAVPFFALSSVLIAALQAMHIVRWRLLVKYLCEPVAKAALTVLLLWAGWGLFGALAGFAIALVLSSALAFLPFRSSRLERQGNAGVSPRQLLQYSGPLALALVFASIGNRSDVLLLGHFAPMSQVGIYSAAFQTASIIGLILQSFESILQPLFSERIASDDRAGLEQTYLAMLRWVGLVVIPLFVLISMFAAPLLSLYGKEYESGAWCLIVLAFAQCLNSMTAPAHGLLALAGHSRLIMWNSLVVAAIQITLNALLVTRHGMMGVAVATGLSLVIVNLVRVIQVNRLLGILPIERLLWKPLTSALLAFVAITVARTWSVTENLEILALGFITIYGVLLYVMGLHEDDRRILASWVDKCRMQVRVPANV